MTEQRLQLSARFSDDDTVREGRLLGPDSLVGFHPDVPSWRERLLVRMHGTMPSVFVSSEVVRVETGEVLCHDMVARTPNPGKQGWDADAGDVEPQSILRISLEESLSESIRNHDQAFR